MTIGRPIKATSMDRAGRWPPASTATPSRIDGRNINRLLADPPVGSSAEPRAAGAQALAGSSSEIRNGPAGKAVPVNDTAR
jgi:hypothetical protein